MVGLRVVALCFVFSCNRIPEPTPEPRNEALQQPAATPAAAPKEPEAPTGPETTIDPQTGKEVIKRRGPEPGWSPLSLKDTLPICVFPNMIEREKAPYLKDVKPQKLSANAKVTFGVFGPGCLSEACDDRPMLQCWTEQEPGSNIIDVKTRFFSFHKDGAECTENCMDLDTACDSQVELKPGKYTVRHGDKTYKLQVPGLVKDPCFGAK
ncbi:MAG TPA: hypothetical protein VFN67_01995 [Polyangiales bacterium]|nr:hypothetical protein [Polyangiales bacterium]